MEKFKKKLKKYMEILKKYRLALLVLLFGIVLMCMPMGEKSKEGQMDSVNIEQPVVVHDDFRTELQNILTQIEGVGKVSVLLTYETGEERTFQQDTKISISGDAEDKEQETVILALDKEQVPLVISTKYPTYRGAVVVCQGADRAVVKLAVIEAVSSLTGLRTEDITVIKMKGS